MGWAIVRLVRGLLVGLVLVAVLLVIGDRVGAWAAQRTVADQVAAELASNGIESAPPEVSIDRVPFLTQVTAGRYESVTLRLRDVNSAGIRLPLVELTATGVTATVNTLLSGEGPIDAEQVHGTATIGYGSVAALPELDDLELGAAADGLLQVRVPAELLGTPVTLTGVGELSAADGAVQLRVDSLEVEEPSGMPAGAEQVIEEITQQLSFAVPLPPLPYGLTIDSVQAEPAGLVVNVSASNVPLAR